MTILNIEAMAEAKKIAMTWLDNRGIRHCEICPENRSLVKSGPNVYRCLAHKDIQPAMISESKK
jgi:hypothetical protein